MKQTRKPMSKETREKIRMALTGVPTSEETKKKMREAKLGKTFVQEHKANMSASHYIRWCEKNGECPIERVLYSKHNDELKQLIIDKILERG